MVDEEIMARIVRNNAEGEEVVKFIESQLPLLKKAAVEKRSQQLEAELLDRNVQLKKELSHWMARVVELEKMIGIQQVSMSDSSAVKVEVMSAQQDAVKIQIKSDHEESSKPVENVKQLEKQQKKEISKSDKKEKNAKVANKAEKQPVEEKEVDVSRLDFRIGRILSAKKHPEADSLYVEDIDVGEAKSRTVVSGLVKFVPLDEMQNRLVVVLCNLKPAKMRGVMSEAMVMCASTPEKVEILTPPNGSVPGDRVVCVEFPGEPDALLPPKKKIFEQVAPDLKTDGTCQATYKGRVLEVAGKGVVKATSLLNVQIK